MSVFLSFNLYYPNQKILEKLSLLLVQSQIILLKLTSRITQYLLTLILVRPSIHTSTTLTKISMPIEHPDVSVHISYPFSSLLYLQVLVLSVSSKFSFSYCP